MIEDIKFKHIVIYILIVALQLLFFSPKLVIGTNIPILFTYFFGLLDHQKFVDLRGKISFDTTFLAITLSIACIILIFSDIAFIGTTLLILVTAILWKAEKE